MNSKKLREALTADGKNRHVQAAIGRIAGEKPTLLCSVEQTLLFHGTWNNEPGGLLCGAVLQAKHSLQRKQPGLHRMDIAQSFLHPVVQTDYSFATGYRQLPRK